jgi:hypothetical protein
VSETPERWEKDTTWRSFIAEGVLAILTIGAYSVAYWSQVEVVYRHAFKSGAVLVAGVSWESLIWGGSTELGALIALFLAREAIHRGTPSWGAWVIAVACTGMSLTYNLLAGGSDWIGIVAHVWMPVLALGCWAWMLEGRHVRWNPRWRERARGVASALDRVSERSAGTSTGVGVREAEVVPEPVSVETLAPALDPPTPAAPNGSHVVMQARNGQSARVAAGATMAAIKDVTTVGCAWPGCPNPSRHPRSPFCSEACKKRAERARKKEATDG